MTGEELYTHYQDTFNPRSTYGRPIHWSTLRPFERDRWDALANIVTDAVDDAYTQGYSEGYGHGIADTRSPSAA